MLSFESDYICGAHPKVLEALAKTNMVAVSGYGCDEFTESAAKKILDACGLKNGEVVFLTGGTQTNSTIISTMLNEFEGVAAAKTGHVAVHEAGAIEYTGHKVLELPAKNGKMAAEDLASYMKLFYGDGNHEHMVFPGMAYISFPTEYGTLYSKQELTDIHNICKEYGIPLFIDGARLGYGLMSYECDLTLPELASLCEVFYIGGTKVGALCGEAVVFTDKKNMPAHFVNRIKKRGALLAKGRLNGVQFDALFTNDLYFEISRHAIDCAERLKKMLKDKGYTFLMDSPTNQQFVVLENNRMEELSKKFVFSFWEEVDKDHTAVRLATSWSTTKEDLDALEEIL